MFYNGQGSSDAVKKIQVTSADICTIRGMAEPYFYRGNPYTGKRYKCSVACMGVFSLFYVTDKTARCRSPTAWRQLKWMKLH
ncbi:hypothetical protein D7V82_21650 [bacterium 1xD8-6]|nr:hypothetical protein D7V72_22100 [bacterium D16-36]RKI62535.1 hypothetical protein D7V82_21650 [bacterium 1xD8-6]